MSLLVDAVREYLAVEKAADGLIERGVDPGEPEAIRIGARHELARRTLVTLLSKEPVNTEGVLNIVAYGVIDGHTLARIPTNDMTPAPLALFSAKKDAENARDRIEGSRLVEAVVLMGWTE